ncbi:cell wall surface anchor family protein [Acidovorax phage ACP17]|uniref:Cell wall surface anchor family protein n=1 Tax=Acidovorax phage ACP17 TaxID=2010329 RepID=A0A218M352_9CAUD|nr:cell wall surface anchor family protein [Acidovorax phage ACP17]ASD50459.1 cell wall surface anchor family protein [Acidovorax phage ACP17]
MRGASVSVWFGNGRLAGVTKVDGAATGGVTVEVFHKASGVRVASVVSNTPTGQFEVLGLNPAETFDLVSKAPGKTAAVSDLREPVAYLDPLQEFVVAQVQFVPGYGHMEIGGAVRVGEATTTAKGLFHRVDDGGPFPGVGAMLRANRTTGDYTHNWIEGPGVACGTADFCAETYVRLHNGGATPLNDVYPRIFQFGSTQGTRGWVLALNMDKRAPNMILETTQNGSYMGGLIASLGQIPNNRWVHVAVTRQGTTWRVFVDGALRGSADYAFDYANTSFYNNRIGLGCNANSSASNETANADFAMFRYTVGNARYTSAFTPPTPYAMPERVYSKWSGDNDSNYADVGEPVTVAIVNPSIARGGFEQWVRADQPKSSGKWYWEVKVLESTSKSLFLGVCDADQGTRASLGYLAWVYVASGSSYNGPLSQQSTYGAAYDNNDVIGFALDIDAGTLECFKNGVSQGIMASNITGTVTPMFAGMTFNYSFSAVQANFGETPFAYSPPSGFNSGWYREL